MDYYHLVMNFTKPKLTVAHPDTVDVTADVEFEVEHDAF